MNVLEAAQQRIRMIFDHCDNIIVAFSGGKDSGVMLNLAKMEARKRGRRITIAHIDYEGQYQATTDYVTNTLQQDNDICDVTWICLPIAAECSVNMTDDHWLPWDNAVRDLWVRELPDHPGVIHEGNIPDGFPSYHGVRDYTFQANLTKWLHKKADAERTAVLVGIRTQESLHRYSALNRQDSETHYLDWKWSTTIAPNVINMYPIYDWETEDIWAANATFGWEYNQLYDLMYYAGVPIHAMRVASPFNSQATDTLKLYRVIDPAMWAKLVGRVNGANFTAIYGGTSAMGWKNITLPAGHTWKTYCEFLLSTLPEKTRNRYLKKFSTSLKYWTETGGALRVEIVDELKEQYSDLFTNLGTPTDKRRRNVPHEVIKFHDYPDDLDITDFSAVPTYKRMCITILKNDHACKFMGFGQTKAELAQRKQAIERFKDII